MAELPDWFVALENTEATDCKTLFFQRMLKQAMELQLAAANSQAAAKSLVRHVEARQADLIASEDRLTQEQRQMANKLGEHANLVDGQGD